ncbi:hypothetical protein CBR_g4652 [Chara braunii]|uniref:Uncharacterized protein n=1 Tax=Chara braunii TaxID=69332 RepID=A0A388KIN1_CHABU|nr:hypothetical protein CBR_g4652 [Chara braunii]|eukprot:GBG69823.1 hypothetical protein CBR_g4652 [Chara braunii]
MHVAMWVSRCSHVQPWSSRVLEADMMTVTEFQSRFCFGLKLTELTVNTTDARGKASLASSSSGVLNGKRQKGNLVHKLIEVSGVSLYWDPNDEEVGDLGNNQMEAAQDEEEEEAEEERVGESLYRDQMGDLVADDRYNTSKSCSTSGDASPRWWGGVERKHDFAGSRRQKCMYILKPVKATAKLTVSAKCSVWEDLFVRLCLGITNRLTTCQEV